MAPASLEFLFWIWIKKLFFHCTKDSCGGDGQAGEERDRVINVYSAANDERAQRGQTYCVDGIDTLPTLVPFSLHPVSVEVGE